MSLDRADEKSMLVYEIAWCRQTTSHYLIWYYPDLSRHMSSPERIEYFLLHRHDVKWVHVSTDFDLKFRIKRQHSYWNSDCVNSQKNIISMIGIIVRNNITWNRW